MLIGWLSSSVRLISAALQEPALAAPGLTHACGWIWTGTLIEIASVDLLKDGTITNQRSILVRPPIPIPPESSAVHHLIDADLSGAPPLMDVVGMFRS